MSLVRSIHDRRCTHVDEHGIRCITRLCWMNPGPDCFVHTTDREARGDEVREERRVGVLMRQEDERERISA